MDEARIYPIRSLRCTVLSKPLRSGSGGSSAGPIIPGPAPGDVANRNARTHPSETQEHRPAAQAPRPDRRRQRRYAVRPSLAAQHHGEQTASPSEPRPGPCTRPRTGHCRGQASQIPRLSPPRVKGPFAFLRTGLRPSLTRPPTPRAVLDTPPPAGAAGGPPARDPSSLADSPPRLRQNCLARFAVGGCADRGGVGRVGLVPP
jgi:hypothetical protein